MLSQAISGNQVQVTELWHYWGKSWRFSGRQKSIHKKVMSWAFFSVHQIKRQRQTLILKCICPEMYTSTGNLCTFMTQQDLESTGFKHNYNLKWLDWVLVWVARRDRSKCSGLVVRCSLEKSHALMVTGRVAFLDISTLRRDTWVWENFLALFISFGFFSTLLLAFTEMF